MIPVTLPQLSISMEDGKVLRWLVDDGAKVSAGQPVVEVETDKATVEVEAPSEGTIRRVIAEGTVVAVEATLAEILEPSAAEPQEAPPPTEEPALVPPSRSGRENGSEQIAPTPSSAQSGAGAAAAAAPPRDGKVTASPAARRIAQERGIDLTTVTGSGPNGRIVVADLEGVGATRPAPAPAPARGTSAPPPPSAAPARERNDLRAAVLANISASWQTIPHVHIGGELEADGLVAARRAAASRGGEKATVTDLLILAVARALTDVPEVNGGASHVHLSLAVATDATVVAPVLRNVTDLGLGAIARERARLVTAARAGELDPRDLAGGTCTLSNLGAYPVDFFAPIVSGPQVAMIATGRVADKPVAVDGMLAVRPRVWVNVALDHRGADGEAGGRFLAALERRLRDLPTSL